MTPLVAEPKQLTLKEDGLIYFQADPSNPTPGVAIAMIKRGEAAMRPDVALLPVLSLAEKDANEVLETLRDWLHRYIARILEPLVKMVVEVEALPEPVRAICERVHAGLGVIPRADLSEFIEKLDADMRKTLRARHIKLGPVLVFVPDLTKPAAVRLRAVLWSLMHEAALPPSLPRDGAVSVIIVPEGANAEYYQAIGYPLYGNRIIRIDMLDRVMSAIFDNVKDNQFQARHEMAEWLGCSIPDLYTVLESMGHRKLHDPADQKPVESTELAESAPAAEPEPMSPAAEETSSPENTPVSAEGTASEVAEPTPAVPAAPAKPPLATFRVSWPRRPAKAPPPLIFDRKPKDEKEERKYTDKPKGDGKWDPNKPRAKRDDDGKKGKPSRRRDDDRRDRAPRNITVGDMTARPEDSPFAILSGLKLKGDKA